jgi:hypothetical protein
MPPKSRTENSARSGGANAAASALNKAKAAFEERLKQAPGAAEDTGGGLYPHPPMMPFAPYPPPGWSAMPPMMMSKPPWGPEMLSYSVPTVPAMRTPFYESVRRMLHLGVTLANSVLAGGLQIMQGYAGAGLPGPHDEECRHHRDCGCGCWEECCYEDECFCSCCCNPGVRGC